MKRFLILVICFFALPVFADELITPVAEQTKTEAVEEISVTDNKFVIVVQKQPLNEKSHQKVTLKKNWFGLYIQVNGKVKINPLVNNYEVE